jgi:membrane protease YdiL (CAAX protease family)
MNKKFEMFMNIVIYLAVFILAQFFASYLAIFVFYIMNINELKSFTDIVYLQEEITAFISQHTPTIYIISFVFSVLGYYMLFKAKKKNVVKEVGFFKIPFYKVFILFFVGVAANVVVDFLLDCIVYYFNLEHSFAKHNTLIEGILSTNNVLLLLLSTGIMYPVLEEVIFRGFIFNELKKNISTTKAIGIQAFLFGLLHLNLIQGSYAFLLGLFFAYIYLWTGSIWAPIVLHIGLNTYTVIMNKFPQLSLNSTLHLVLSVFVLIAGTVIIYKTKIERQDSNELKKSS